MNPNYKRTVRTLFLRTFSDPDLDSALALAIALAMYPFGRLVMLGDAKHRDSLAAFWNAIFAEDFDDPEARFYRDVDYVVTTDQAWRQAVHAEMVRSDCVIMHLNPASARFPPIRVPSSIDAYYQSQLMAPVMGNGFLYEVAYLERLNRLNRTLLLCRESDADYLSSLLKFAFAAYGGDSFRGDGRPLHPKISALNKQLGLLCETVGLTTYVESELTSPFSGFIDDLTQCIQNILILRGRVTSSVPDERQLSLPVGRSAKPRSLPPDDELKIIEYTNVLGRKRPEHVDQRAGGLLLAG
jgi:hypothetical protein